MIDPIAVQNWFNQLAMANTNLEIEIAQLEKELQEKRRKLAGNKGALALAFSLLQSTQVPPDEDRKE